MGGGFKDDEPGSRVEEGDGAGRQSQEPPPVQDVHTRESEMNDEYLGGVRRANRAGKPRHDPPR